jgi:uncharacterized protein
MTAEITTGSVDISIGPRPGEPAGDEGGCACSSSGACCQCAGSVHAEPVPVVTETDGIKEPAAAASGILRTSSYTIYVDMPHNPGEMLLVHGYTGAFDKVSTRVATYLRAKEDRRAPKPLYGDWAPDPVVADAPDLPDNLVDVLLQRGYLTNLTREEELERFTFVADSVHGQQTYPGYVLMPTYDCNLRCFYCFQDHMRTNPDFAYLLKRMSLSMVDRIFDAMPQIEALHGIAPGSGYERPITLFGGEPLLRDNRDLIEHILVRAHEGGTRSLSAVTNATDLDAYEDLLGPENLSQLQVTLDGVPEEHDKRRIYPDGQGSFAAISRNITLALRRDAKINIRMNIDRNNVKDLPRLAQIFVDEGWSEDPNFLAYTAPVHATNDKTARESTFSSWELDQALDQLRAEHPVMRIIMRPDEQLRSRVLSIFMSGNHPGLQPTYCGAHKGMYVIDKFGDLYACWERTGNAKVRIGRIAPDCTIEMNESNTSMWRTRTVTANPVCNQCRYALYCGGGCAVLAEGRKGRIDRNYCDGYAFRFRAMVAEAYSDYKDGKLNVSAAVASPFTM